MDYVHALEAVLFASGDPISIDRLASVLEIEREDVIDCAEELELQYRKNNSGIRIIRLEDEYQMCSNPDFADIIVKTMRHRKPPKLSQAALEVLSIVAYFQPVTRAYIEDVRGVDSSYSVNMLTERGLIEPCGKLEVPGRPTLFRTTENFLRVMEIEQLEDLPALPEIAPEEGVDALRAAIEQKAESGVQMELDAHKDEPAPELFTKE
ncbi:MAG: SMC-Scp complex subunit ScpB [Oscillospiraceae bacterium]|nr:SMC-Scp complex subunit ScpB [Oscillospiraceae bacterium]